MLTIEQSKSLVDLRADALDYQAEIERHLFECSDDPIAIQNIWAAILDGYKARLGRAINHAKETVGDSSEWRETIDAADLALSLWREFECEHGDESLLDFSKFDTATMKAFQIETDAHARKLIVARGQTFRDAAVSFDLWIIHVFALLALRSWREPEIINNFTDMFLSRDQPGEPGISNRDDDIGVRGSAYLRPLLRQRPIVLRALVDRVILSVVDPRHSFAMNR
jgi:hypothetical protein